MAETIESPSRRLERQSRPFALAAPNTKGPPTFEGLPHLPYHIQTPQSMHAQQQAHCQTTK